MNTAYECSRHAMCAQHRTNDFDRQFVSARVHDVEDFLCSQQRPLTKISRTSKRTVLDREHSKEVPVEDGTRDLDEIYYLNFYLRLSCRRNAPSALS